MLHTLRQKFTAIYLALVACVILVGGTAAVSLHVINRNVDKMIEQDYVSIQAVDEMLETIDRQDSAVLTYLSIDKNQGINLFTEGMQTFIKWQVVLNNNMQGTDHAELVNNMRSWYDQYCKDFSLLQEEVGSSGTGQAVEYYNTKMTPAFEEIKTALRNLRAYNNDLIQQTQTQVKSQAQIQGWVILTATIILSGAGIIISIWQTKRLLTPLYQLTDAIKSVSADGFHQQLDIHTSGEIRLLELEFNNMISRLEEYDRSNVGELLSEKKKFELILDNMEDAFFILNKNLMVESANPAAKKLLEKADQIEDRHILELISNDELYRILRRAGTEAATHSEGIITLGDDEQVYRVSVSHFFNGDGDPGHFMLLIQNITSLKSAERMRSDFIATISHELKTPLTTIQMGAGMLSSPQAKPLDQGQLEIVNAIQDDVERLSRLIDDLLELSKVQAGAVSYQLHPISISAVANQSMEQFAERSKYSGVSLISHIPEDLPMVTADPEKLIWVFNNILNNAFQYTKTGDRIELDGKVTDNFVEISISDSGLGITKENLNKIFENNFHYSENDIEFRGSGIGLYLSKNIITAHRGTIWVESEPNRGSKFIFTLPTGEGGVACEQSTNC